MGVRVFAACWLVLFAGPLWARTMPERPGYFVDSGKGDLSGNFGAFLLTLSRGAIHYSCGGGTIRQTFPGAEERDPAGTSIEGRASRLSAEGAAAHFRTFSTVVYRDLYPGISLRFTATSRGLKSEFEVAPGADPSRIRVRYNGGVVRHLTNGDLAISCSGDTITEHNLVAFERSENGVETPVSASYRILDDGTVAFSIGAYDRLKTLVIDPYILYHAASLGSTLVDIVTSIAVDSAGNIYGAGYSESPLLGAMASTQFYGGVDAFVFKLEAGTRRLLFVSYLGGRGDDRAASVAVDGAGNIYVAGYTQSHDFMGSSPAVLGSRDAFVIALNTMGDTIRFMRMLRGSGTDDATSIATATNGDLWVTGTTDSADFSVSQPFQWSLAGGKDCFLVRLNSLGAIQYASFFGGAGDDQAAAVAVDSSGSPFLTGSTTSANLPMRAASQATRRGGQDAFVARFTPAANDLVYSTYLGGQLGLPSNPETGWAIAVDASANAYVVGSTPSPDFPATAYQAAFGGGTMDAFVSRISPSGSITASTYYGGTSTDTALGIAIASNGIVWVVGYTGSVDLPVVEPVQRAHGGMHDAFVVAFGPDLRSVVFASFLGGSQSESFTGVRQMPDYTIVVSGVTGSLNATPIVFTGGIDPYVLTFLPQKSAEHFVIDLYKDVLVREPDPFGFSAWTSIITTGRLTRAEVAQEFMRSDEARLRSLYIIKLYLGILLRDPDYEGWRAWTGALARTESRPAIVAGFLNSPEFQLRYGSLTDEAFIRQLYRNLLGREADPGGFEAWKRALALGTSRNDVAVGFLDSAEFDIRTRARAQTDLFYMSLLQRTGDPAGLDGWQRFLASYSLAHAVQGIITSPEYLRAL